MDHEKIDSIVYFMNLAEQMISGKDNPISKKKYVVEKITNRYPDVDEEIVEDAIELLVNISKKSLPLLINLDDFSKKNNSCVDNCCAIH